MRRSMVCIGLIVIRASASVPDSSASIEFQAPVFIPSDAGPYDVVLSDIDVDGDLDAVASNYDGHSVRTWLNDGAGNFTPLATYPDGGSLYALVADLNADGLPDLAIVDALAATVTTRQNTGGGAFGPGVTVSVGTTPRCIAAVDWDHDGDLELAIAEFGASDVRILHRVGPGLTFGSPQVYNVGASPKWITSADLDGDGFAELITANYSSGSITVLKSQPPGAPLRTDYTTSVTTSMVVVASLNGDLLPDAAVVDEHGHVKVLPGTGGATFGGATDYLVDFNDGINQGIVSGDFDADGDVDLAISSYSTNRVYTLANLGDGTFGGFDSFLCGSHPRGLNVGDVSGDDRLDLAVTNFFGSSGFSILKAGPHSGVGGEGINLSWDDCGTHGVSGKDFACDTNGDPPFTLVASFTPPTYLPHFLGVSADFSIVNVAGGIFPDWWRIGTDQCRPRTDLSTDFDFTPSSHSCNDVLRGRAVGGFLYLNIGETLPPTEARLLVQLAIPAGEAEPVYPDSEYYAFKVRIATAHSTGPDACARCEYPMRIRLKSLQLFQPMEDNYDPIITAPINTSIALWQPSGSTPVQVALVAVESYSDHNRIVWELGRDGAATVYRREAAGEWRSLDRLVPDGEHRIEYVDRDVRAGGAYRYRLGLVIEGEEIFAGETSLIVPALALSLSRIAWTGKGITASVSLPGAEGATLEVFDASGRRTLSHRLEGMTEGEHRVEIATRFAPGVYFGRLTQGRNTVTGRFVVMQ